MRCHHLRVHASDERLAPHDELAYAIARVAADPAPVDDDVAAGATLRLIDAFAVGLAALRSPAVTCARAQALAHPRAHGARVFGLAPSTRVDAQWAAWANCAAVRDLDFNDSFFARDTAHPSDSIAAVLAVAAQCDCDGAALVRGIVTAYEIQLSLAKGLPLIVHGFDQSTHQGPAMAAGIGALLDLDTDTIHQAVRQAAHCAVTTRQARQGAISTWKACVPGFSAQIAIAAVDRAMRGEAGPGGVYEGPEGLVATCLGGRDASYDIPLVAPGSAQRALLESYPKAHAVGYASQAFVDLALRLRARVGDPRRISEVLIHTCGHHHRVHGSGSGDPQKYDPQAPRETLDHSIMYAFTVALEDGSFHHRDSYAPQRAARPATVALWARVRTVCDPVWDDAYEHAADHLHKAQGGRVEIRFTDGGVLEESITMPDAHPLGAAPFTPAAWERKFTELAAEVADDRECAAFLATARRLPALSAGEVRALGIEARDAAALALAPGPAGIFGR